MLLVLAFTSVWAGVPQLLTYQGYLADSGGDPVADGTYSITFSIYNALEGGTAEWTETQTGVTVTDGVFSVLLGSSTPITDEVFAGPERFLEVTFDGEPQLPRAQITAVGYAHRISTLDGAKGGLVGDSVVIVSASALASGKALIDVSRITLAVTGDGGSISLYDPVDSKAPGAIPTKRFQMFDDGLIMFGVDESDTTLVVAPNGDIVGVGQITMGENSSSGIETSVLGFQNTADGDSSTIGGGSANFTSGTISVISGGHANSASGEGSVIGGGGFNDVSGDYATIGGGRDNTAAGAFATVTGGDLNSADGDYSHAAGHRAKALHPGSFVWADATEQDFVTTGPDQFIVRATGGVGIGTDNPTGQLEVAAAPGDGSVTLPDDAIAAREILDEPGLAMEQASSSVTLNWGQPMVSVATVTITIPADGYILLQGGATLETYGTSGRNQAYLQIDETPGGAAVAPYWSLAGSGDHDSPNKTHNWSMHAQRSYMKAAGTYTFVLEAQQSSSNDAAAVATIINPVLTATYLPTSYGTVSATSTTGSTRFDR